MIHMKKSSLIDGAKGFRASANSAKILILSLLMLFGISVAAHAKLELDLTKGTIEPLPIAITNFSGDIGAETSSIVSSNLKNSGLFAPIDPAAFIQQISDPNAVPRFEDWRVINAQA